MRAGPRALRMTDVIARMRGRYSEDGDGGCFEDGDSLLRKQKGHPRGMALIIAECCDGRATHQRQTLRLFVGGDGAGFVVVDVEHGVELGELQDVLNLAGEVEQLESGTLIFGSCVSADEFTEA